MKIPRDVSGWELIKVLSVFGYEPVSQNGSHIKVTTTKNGQHHIAVPNHNPVKIGTLSGILSDVASHFGLTEDEVVRKLFS